MNLDPTSIILGLLSLFFVVTFLQSGIDKVTNRSGNLSWFQSVFEGTFLKPIITPVFYWITIQELFVGIWMLVAAYCYFFCECYCCIFTEWGFVFCLALLIQLFSGQRIAKDYPGASGIIPYILTALVALGLFSSCCCS
jgi:uncharacterized membrane protein YphA (DoxX/SURF4 family)